MSLLIAGTICIDTGAYDLKGWLTCLEVESGKYWQANQAGEKRTGVLGHSAAEPRTEGESEA